MKNKKGDDWIPLWIDKWLFGSMRHELNPEERSVWTDFLALAGKDDGFIRANEITPYPISQLAGLLCVSPEIVESTIKKCVEFGKITITEYKTLYITKHEEYELSGRHRRRIDKELELEKNKIESKSKRGSKKEDIVSPKEDITDKPISKRTIEPPKGKDESQYNANDLLWYFCKLFNDKIGIPYTVVWGKDNKLFAELLKVPHPPKRILNMIDLFFDDDSEKSWTKDKLDVGVFKSQVNKLAIKINEIRSVSKGR